MDNIWGLSGESDRANEDGKGGREETAGRREGGW